MSLKQRLQDDLTTAMKERDELARATLRMVLTAVHTEEVSGRAARELSDDEVQKVVVREAKKRREAAEAFRAGGAGERADRELAEGAVLEAYLPQQLSDDELSDLVRAVVAETGAQGRAGMGTAMKAVGPRVAGRADGSRVAAAVRDALG